MQSMTVPNDVKTLTTRFGMILNRSGATMSSDRLISSNPAWNWSGAQMWRQVAESSDLIKFH